MRIAQLAPLIESVPPHGYGGTELVVSLLTEELVKQGHEVTLFATADSRTEARLISCAPTGVRAAGVPVHRWASHEMESILTLLKRQSEFDIIHNHLGFYALPFIDQADCAIVTTNHNPIMDYCKNIYLDYKHQPFISISDAYQRFNFPDELNYVARVYNGIETEAFMPIDNPNRDYVLFIGRICEAKGTKEAIQIARAVGQKIILAGKVDPSDQVYYEKEIKDLIDGDTVKYIGEVNYQQKLELYQNALAVIYPINFEEPFGLVMAEAIATGTPIVALDRGSVREVLSDNETAIIGSSVEELIQRFPEIDKIERKKCIERCRSLFGKERMAAAYVEVYEKLIAANNAKKNGNAQENQQERKQNLNSIGGSASSETCKEQMPGMKAAACTEDPVAVPN